MKKSIVAMLSITALATVANAGDTFTQPTGTHFEGIQNGAAFYPSNDDAGTTAGPEFFWYAATNGVACEAQFGVYTNADYMGSSYSGDRPATPVATTTTDMCLSIDTEGERLIRRMGPAPLGSWRNSDFVQYDVKSSIYFDSLVQFTVNEDDPPTPKSGDKLAVWLQGGETTNLVVTAGYFAKVGNDDTLVATNYVVTTNNVAVTLEPGTWHRLTIEAINIFDTNEDAFVGFRIYVDGTLLNTGSAISANPFWDSVEGEGLSVFDDHQPTTTAISYVEDGVLFPALYSSGDNHATLSCVAFEGTGALDDFVFTTTNPFPDAPTPAVPTVDGNEPTDGTAFIAAATSGTANILPTDWTLDGNTIKDGNGDTYATIPPFYTATLTDGTLTLALNTNAIPAIAAATVESEAKEAIEVDATTFTATLTGTNSKLYYGLSVATTPNPATWPKPTRLTQGDGTPKQITADKPVDGENNVLSAGFFKVYVTDIAPTTPTQEPAGE